MRVQRAEIQIRVFYTSALDRVRWSALLLDRFTRRETNPVIWRTKDWFKVVTQSKILIPEENLSLSAGFGALSLLKKKKKSKFTSHNNIYKSFDIPVINGSAAVWIKIYKVMAFIQKILLGFYFFWGLLQSASRNIIKKRVLGTWIAVDILGFACSHSCCCCCNLPHNVSKCI